MSSGVSRAVGEESEERDAKQGAGAVEAGSSTCQGGRAAGESVHRAQSHPEGVRTARELHSGDTMQKPPRQSFSHCTFLRRHGVGGTNLYLKSYRTAISLGSWLGVTQSDADSFIGFAGASW